MVDVRMQTTGRTDDLVGTVESTDLRKMTHPSTPRTQCTFGRICRFFLTPAMNAMRRPDDRQTARDEQSVFTVVLCQRVASDSLAEGWREGDGWRLDALIGVKQNAEAHFLTMERSEMVEEIGSILFPHLHSPIGGFSFFPNPSHPMVLFCTTARFFTFRVFAPVK